jgi:class 3 adenylate cyclase
VTVLFADVVRSMDMAAALDIERLREIMTELVNRCAAVVLRYGGTVDKFTGDGIMALFGAPVALEDHAVRACLAALEVQHEAARLAADVERRDGMALQVRVGLNSGQVIAGEIGSSALGYTAVGQQVGLAQRMESVAAPGGVMLSESTARLVENVAVLGEPEWVRIKGADAPVPARRLLGMSSGRGVVARQEASLVGRHSEMATLDALVDRAIGGRGGVVNVVGPPGIGKSRVAREATALAAARGVEVVWAACESHAREIPFHAVTRLLRAAFGIADVDGEAARAVVRERVPDADPQDLLLLGDLLGIARPDVPLPQIDPDARRRRLTALIKSTMLARTAPALFIIEDAHWVDAVSESMLADFLTVIPRTKLMVLITSRPEYEGAMTRVHDARAIVLGPLGDSDTATLLGELLGSDPSVGELTAIIAERAAGNPFFAEEMVRELAQRGVLAGEHGGYVCGADVADVAVPATVQAAIEARIDRLSTQAKRTLHAASVIGARFGPQLLAALGIDSVFNDLLSAELIDQVQFSPSAEYAFCHPLIRAVAYESQLKSDRAEWHRRLATAIQEYAPGSVEENAALIAEHLEAAGELRAAYGWHMRAAAWSTNRDIIAARLSWERARRIADTLPADDPDQLSMRIAPRTMLWGTAYRIGGAVAETGFDQLRDLCDAAGDQISLAMGMSGLLVSLTLNHRFHELTALASEYAHRLQSIGDPALIVGLMNTAGHPKLAAGEIAEALRLAERVIELAEGDTTKGSFFFESPLAWGITLRGLARCSLGDPRWRDDLRAGLAMARTVGGITQSAVTTYGYVVPVLNGALVPDASIVRDTLVALDNAERFGDNVSLAWARIARGTILTRLRDADQDVDVELLQTGREQARRHGDMLTATPADVATAEYKTQTGNIDGAIEMSRTILGHLFDSGEMLFRGPATTVLVESLLRRGTETDLQEAQAVIDQLAAVPTEPGFVLYEITLLRLRALLARARGDDVAYRDLVGRYHEMAKSLGFEGHIAWAEAMIEGGE